MVHTTLKLEISCNREQSQACLGYAERSQFYAKIVQVRAEPSLPQALPCAANYMLHA